MNKISILFLTILIFFLTILYSNFIFHDPDTILWLCREDGMVEYLGSISFLIASIIFFSLYFKDKEKNDFILFKTKKNVFYLLLGLAFFFAFAEEISWGQRIFNFGTPEIMDEINRQSEFNIHNINIFHGGDEQNIRKPFFELFLNIDRLFSFFWLSFCFLVPVMNKYVPPFSRWLKKINLPIVPIWFGVFFLVNYILSKYFERNIPGFLHHSLTELKESGFAFLFFLLSIYFYHAKNIKSSAIKES
ncbi:MAG: hypothetical protein KAI43_09750 [Candidatus Aureabacteria bacterium]|nr:hypothetical protein [Candidatus Auribacterota bacterium]